MDFDVCPAFFAGRDVSDLPFQLFRHLRITAALTGQKQGCLFLRAKKEREHMPPFFVLNAVICRRYHCLALFPFRARTQDVFLSNCGHTLPSGNPRPFRLF